MPKTSDLAANPYPSILLVGDGGSHKTHFVGTCPKPYIYDFDAGTAILRENKEAEYDRFKEVTDEKLINPEKGFYRKGTAWPAFISHINKHGEQLDKGTLPFRTLALDSLTTLADICMAYVLKSDGHVGNPQIQHWGSQIQLLQAVMDQFSSWPVIKVVTAHIQRNTNEVNQQVEMLPLVTGKLAGKVGIYFDEVYFCGAVPDEKSPFGRKWTVTTAPTGMIKGAKSRYGVPSGTELTWEAIAPYVTGKKLKAV